MKIIFLDFDGVLNNGNFAEPWPGHTALLEGYTDRDRFGLLFDAGCVRRLKQLIETTDAGVVISSSWRFAGLDFIQAMWEERALPGRLIGLLPWDTDMDGGWLTQRTRGHYIRRWLNENPTAYYVIIDDTNDFLGTQQDRLVLTDYDMGFSEADLVQALAVLAVPE